LSILGYKANPIARNLSSGESRLIGYVVSNIACYFYIDMATGIEKTINSQNYQLLLMDSKDSKRREMQHIESLLLRGVDGIIIAPTTTDYGFLNGLLPEGFPVVFLDRQPLNYQADYVLLNNSLASFEATRYLINKGYTRIAYITYHLLNTQSGSVYDAWKNLSAIEELTDTEASWLERTCIPAIEIDLRIRQFRPLPEKKF
jgi:LacI family transcriptional regulator